MNSNELTENQIQLFLQYGSVPAGYSKEEMEEITKHSRPDSYENMAEYRNTRLVGKNYYRFCEICNRPIRGRKDITSPGKFRRGGVLYYPGDIRRRYNAYRYCYICHKSMCNSCMKGVVCKNCQEFYPKEIKQKNKSLIKRLLIIIISSLALPGFAFIALIAMVLLFPRADLRIPMSILVFLIFLSFTSPFLAFYLMIQKQLKFTRNFIDNLNEYTEYDKNLMKEVFAVYDDGHEHIENERRLLHFKIGLWIHITSSIIILGLILSSIIAL